MLYLPEIIIGIILLFTAIIILLSFSPARKARKLDLLKKYRRTQHLSLKFQDTLSHYILRNDKYEDEFIDGERFGEYLERLKNNHQRHLSERRYLKIRNSISPVIFRQTSKLLDKQKEKLKKIKDPILELN